MLVRCQKKASFVAHHVCCLFFYLFAYRGIISNRNVAYLPRSSCAILWSHSFEFLFTSLATNTLTFANRINFFEFFIRIFKQYVIKRGFVLSNHFSYRRNTWIESISGKRDIVVDIMRNASASIWDVKWASLIFVLPKYRIFSSLITRSGFDFWLKIQPLCP